MRSEGGDTVIGETGVVGVKLEAEGDSTFLESGEDGGAGACEGVEKDAVGRGDESDEVSHQVHGFHGRMVSLDGALAGAFGARGFRGIEEAGGATFVVLRRALRSQPQPFAYVARLRALVPSTAPFSVSPHVSWPPKRDGAVALGATIPDGSRTQKVENERRKLTASGTTRCRLASRRRF